MAKKSDEKLSQLKVELKFWVRDFREAQMDLKKLRAIGAKEDDIRNVMHLMGFGGVSPDEFLEARTAEDIGSIMAKLNRGPENAQDLPRVSKRECPCRTN